MIQRKEKGYVVIIVLLLALLVGLLKYDMVKSQNTTKAFEEKTEISQKKDTTYIYCVGDSTTLSTDQIKSYPEFLKSYTNSQIEVIAEPLANTRSLAEKLGAIDIYVNNVILEKDSTPITIYDENGNKDNALLESQVTIEHCSIEGVKGSIIYDENEKSMIFQREKEGDTVDIHTMTKVEIDNQIEKDSILILFTGSYETSVQGSLIDYQQKIIETFDTQKYVVISLTCLDKNMTNEALKETYDQHYLDFKDYLLKDGLADANIEATKEDTQDIQEGEIPSSLRIDDINGNEEYNRLLARKLSQKLQDLGYLR